MASVISAIALILVWIAAIGFSVYGYVHNIILLVGHVGAFGLMEVVRAVGIIAGPLGVVMGYVG